MQNAATGVRRAIARLRTAARHETAARPPRGAAGLALRLIDRAAAVAGVSAGARPGGSRRGSARTRRILGARVASGQVLPIGVALIVLLASVVSLGPGSAQAGTAADTGARIAVGGGYDSVEIAGLLGGPVTKAAATAEALDDGTVWKPVAVDTSIQDGKSVMRYYTVQAGDTLTGIASRFGVSMMTIWWANNLTTKDSLKVGQTLMIPPVTGLTIVVKAGDTLDSLATKYSVDGQRILDANGLSDGTLIVGQTLIIPDAAGAPIPTVKKPTSGTCRTNCGFTYTGGKWAWPVNGWNYISQYFHSGHLAIDIAAKYGTPLVSALPGRVVLAGWVSNGGGYQVWVNHGNGLYTAYLHMSSIGTAVGATVSKGTFIGRVGMTGWATGPHVHYEVWIGYPWKGYRVNPLRYY